MSVYTPITQQQLQNFLNLYSLGNLIKFSGIQAGIENTNYRVSSSKGDFILTIFESLSIQKLSCYLNLLKHLGESNFPAPVPQLSKEYTFINQLHGKPAAFFNCLSGSSIDSPSIDECKEIGEYLAKLHNITQTSNFKGQNLKNLAGCQQIFNDIKQSLSSEDRKALSSELTFQINYALPDLPRGIIHADLFKDNVLFNQGAVSAILDFYNACQDYYLFDIAITCNDWCVDNGLVNQHKIQALLEGYQKIRLLSQDEKTHLNIFLRRAALRFWLSRLEHQMNPKEGALTLTKDPLIFRSILEQHNAR